jgi:hypothetical protein
VNVILNGHNVEDSLAHLAELEAGFRDLAGAREGEAVFRVAGRWLVEEGYLHALLRSSFARALGAAPRVPIVGDLELAPLALAAISGSRIRSRSTAVAVCFKNNFRAFYLGARAVTIKIADTSTGGLSLWHEIRARKRIGNTAGVVLPRLIASDPDGASPHLWEEIVFGRRPDPRRDRARFLRQVLPRILDFYAGCGVRYVIGSDFLDLERLTADALEAAEWMPWSAQRVDRSLFRTRVATCGEEADKYLLVGTGHGDLSSGNILITEEGRVCLVDWERSREQILMQDLEKLFQEYPGSWDAAVDRMESWRPEGIDPDRVMPCEQQAMLGILQQVQVFSAPRRENAAMGVKWRRQCDRIVAKEFAAATRLMKQGQL